MSQTQDTQSSPHNIAGSLAEPIAYCMTCSRPKITISAMPSIALGGIGAFTVRRVCPVCEYSPPTPLSPP